MNDISKIIDSQKRDLEAKLALISGNNIELLIAERKDYEAKIAEIDAKLSRITAELGIEVRGIAAPKKERQTRLNGAEIDSRILEAFKSAPEGLSQISISKKSGVVYASVVNWLKANASKVRIEGDRKDKRVFLVQ